jgi:hypothetical protein
MANVRGKSPERGGAFDPDMRMSDEELTAQMRDLGSGRQIVARGVEIAGGRVVTYCGLLSLQPDGSVVVLCDDELNNGVPGTSRLDSPTAFSPAEAHIQWHWVLSSQKWTEHLAREGYNDAQEALLAARSEAAMLRAELADLRGRVPPRPPSSGATEPLGSPPASGDPVLGMIAQALVCQTEQLRVLAEVQRKKEGVAPTGGRRPEKVSKVEEWIPTHLNGTKEEMQQRAQALRTTLREELAEGLMVGYAGSAGLKKAWGALEGWLHLTVGLPLTLQHAAHVQAGNQAWADLKYSHANVCEGGRLSRPQYDQRVADESKEDGVHDRAYAKMAKAPGVARPVPLASTSAKTDPQGPKKDGAACTFCGKRGHTVATCWAKSKKDAKSV